MKVATIAEKMNNPACLLMNSFVFKKKICEEFKESSPYCVPVGLTLADKSYKPVVRHFGLQLLEHAIK